MGDRAPTTFMFPISVLSDPLARLILPEVFHRALPLDPRPDTSEGFGRDTWQGHAVVVHHDPCAHNGGWEAEQGLITAGLPFVRYNAAGADYGPSVTAYDGTHSIECSADRDGYPVVAVEEHGIDPQALADAQAFHGLRRSILGLDSSEVAGPITPEPAHEGEEEEVACLT